MLTTTDQTAVGDALGLGVGIGGSVGGLGAGGVGGVGGIGGPGDLVGAASGASHPATSTPKQSILHSSSYAQQPTKSSPQKL